jgi:hypothetical protein
MTFKSDFKDAMTEFAIKAKTLIDQGLPPRSKYTRKNVTLVATRYGHHGPTLRPYESDIGYLDRVVNTRGLKVMSNHENLNIKVIVDDLENLTFDIGRMFEALPAFSHPKFGMRILVGEPVKSGVKLKITLDHCEFLQRSLTVQNLVARVETATDRLSVFPTSWDAKQFTVGSHVIVAPNPELAFIKFAALYSPDFWGKDGLGLMCDVHEIHQGSSIKTRVEDLRNATAA